MNLSGSSIGHNRLRAVLYLRCSSESQRVQATSIPAQRQVCEAYCLRHGYTILKEYLDDGLTGQTVLRPQWARMLSDARIKPQPYDVVVLYDTDRFDRAFEGEQELRKLRAIGLKVEYGVMQMDYDEEGDLSPESEYLEGNKKVTDRYTVRKLSRDTSRGCKAVAERGFRSGAPAPYGYCNGKRQDGEKMRTVLVPDSDNAPIVVEIFRLKIEGLGNRTIRDRLNERGVPGPRKTRWHESTIREITRNRVYLGESTYNRKHFRRRGAGKRTAVSRPPEKWIVTCGAHQALVSEEMFAAAQQQRQLIKPHDRTTNKRLYLLTGLLACAVCGRKSVARTSKSRHGKTTWYYACASGKSCIAPQVRAQLIESAALDALRNTLADNKAVDAELRRFSNQNRNPELSELNRRLSTAERKAANLLALVEEGDRDATALYRTRKAEIDTVRRELARVGNAAGRVPTTVEVTRAVEAVRAQLDQIAADASRADTLRSMLRVLIAGVTFDYRSREAEIKCRLPVLSGSAATGLRETVIAGA